MKIGILGSGSVAQTLAAGFARHGHEVMVGTREPARLAGWAAQNPQVKVAGFADTAAFGELAILAVKGTAAEKALQAADAGRHLAGKTVIDATNPIAEAPPRDGVLRYFTAAGESLMERLQTKAPQARFVKAFNSVGNAFMINPQFPQTPTMFICGNDGGAKGETSELLRDLGWEIEDMGAIEAARAIEPLCMLWCIPGLRGGSWSHAFKLLKK